MSISEGGGLAAVGEVTTLVPCGVFFVGLTLGLAPCLAHSVGPVASGVGAVSMATAEFPGGSGGGGHSPQDLISLAALIRASAVLIKLRLLGKGAEGLSLGSETATFWGFPGDWVGLPLT